MLYLGVMRDDVGVRFSPIFRQGMTLLTLDSSSFGVMESKRQRIDDLSFVWMAVGFKSLPFPKNPLMDRRESPLRPCRLSSLPLMSPLQVEALKRLDGERIEINEKNSR